MSRIRRSLAIAVGVVGLLQLGATVGPLLSRIFALPYEPTSGLIFLCFAVLAVTFLAAAVTPPRDQS